MWDCSGPEMRGQDIRKSALHILFIRSYFLQYVLKVGLVSLRHPLFPIETYVQCPNINPSSRGPFKHLHRWRLVEGSLLRVARTGIEPGPAVQQADANILSELRHTPSFIRSNWYPKTGGSRERRPTKNHMLSISGSVCKSADGSWRGGVFDRVVWEWR